METRLGGGELVDDGELEPVSFKAISGLTASRLVPHPS